MTIEVTVENVTPEDAKALLTLNTNNYRQLNENTVNRYADLIREGQWLPEASHIVIDWNGVLSDGQHRLKAILKSGTAIDMIIVRCADPRSRFVIDDHMPRRMKDHVRCKAHHIVMVNTFLRAEGLHTTKIKKDVEFYKRHVFGNMGELVNEFNEIYGNTSDPFTSYGVRAALILAVLNDELTKGEAVELFKRLITFRKYKVKKTNNKVHFYQSSTRSAVQSSMPTLLSKLVDLLDGDRLPVYTGVGSRWVNHEYSSTREKASKLMFATYQAICKDTCNETKFRGPLSSQVSKALGI